MFFNVNFSSIRLIMCNVTNVFLNKRIYTNDGNVPLEKIVLNLHISFLSGARLIFSRHIIGCYNITHTL